MTRHNSANFTKGFILARESIIKGFFVCVCVCGGISEGQETGRERG